MWAVLAAGGVVGGGLVGAAMYLEIPLTEIFGAKQRAPPKVEELEIPQPPSRENTHPLDRAPWVKKAFVIVSRGVFLLAIFAPLGVLTGVQALYPKP